MRVTTGAAAIILSLTSTADAGSADDIDEVSLAYSCSVAYLNLAISESFAGRSPKKYMRQSEVWADHGMRLAQAIGLSKKDHDTLIEKAADNKELRNDAGAHAAVQKCIIFGSVLPDLRPH